MKFSKLLVVAAVLVIAAVGVAVAQSSFSSPRGSNETPALAAPGPGSAGQNIDSSWTVPTDQGARAKSAGLTMGPMGTAEHYHPQLSLRVDGKPIPIPADIGVDRITGQMSAVHTHAADGVVHVEAATKGQDFTLGQLFIQWGVHLGPTSLGQMRGGQLTVTVNGERYTEEPSNLRLAEDQKIEVTFTSQGPEQAATTERDGARVP